jgi:hypothetical protein
VRRLVRSLGTSTVHEGTARDGVATDEARDAGATSSRNASTAVLTAQARDAASAARFAAAWTKPTAVA